MCSPMKSASRPRSSTAKASCVIGMISVLGMIDTPNFMKLSPQLGARIFDISEAS